MHLIAELWSRASGDFWPLDRSSVGPNLVASAVMGALIVIHNEYRVIRKDEQRHAHLREIARDAIHEALHPTESAEEHIADAIVDNEKES